ncbi:hypothetical protein [Stagnihabitans tardus]|nr:hypothetical protein [Stagnihabitans tardus]
MSFNLLAIGQNGRLAHEALLLVASLRQNDPGFQGRVFIAEPTGARWQAETKVPEPQAKALQAMGAEILPFENKVFGQSYPYGNKIEALAALPDEPFLFLDTDTLVLSPLSQIPFDFARPSASMKREGTWPKIELYGPSYAEIWGSLYDRFGLDMAPTLDLSQPQDYWQRHLYFNAGWFFHQSPRAFGERFLTWAQAIKAQPPEPLILQELDPWLDQVTLPLVIHSFGGGRPGPELAAMDTTATCHYRAIPLLYAKESDRAVEVLESLFEDKALRQLVKEYEPYRRLVLQRHGRKARALFDQNDLPAREQVIRNTLKREGYWLR